MASPALNTAPNTLMTQVAGLEAIYVSGQSMNTPHGTFVFDTAERASKAYQGVELRFRDMGLVRRGSNIAPKEVEEDRTVSLGVNMMMVNNPEAQIKSMGDWSTFLSTVQRAMPQSLEVREVNVIKVQ